MSTQTAAWQRPPFEPGNDLAVTHGAYSEALTLPRAKELMPTVLEANPHLDVRRDGAAVARYVQTLARIERVDSWLSEQSDAIFADTTQGEVHGVYTQLDRWIRMAAADEERLAIAPLTRARLGLDQLRGFDLARQWAEEDQASGDVDA